MSPREFNPPGTLLRVVLWASTAAIVAVACAMMVTLDASSASQGGRWYVAVIAIVLIAALDSQIRKLLRWRLPFTLGTHPEERRHLPQSLLLLTISGAVLFGTALHLTSRFAGVVPLVRAVLLPVALPLLGLVLLRCFGRQLFDRAFDLLFGSAESPASSPRTLTFSFGTPGPRHTPATRPAGRGLTAGAADRYRRAWRRIQAAFAADPTQAVRDAHALLLALSAEVGTDRVILHEEQTVATDLAGAASQVMAIDQRVADARHAQDAIRRALAREPADPDHLALAMADYGRLLERLIARSDGGGSDIPPSSSPWS